MKVVLLAPANSIHTIQWAKYLSVVGVEISIISQHPKSEDMPAHVPVYLLPYHGVIGYFINSLETKKIIKNIKPDIVHAHYASGYGTLARLVDFHPYVLSVWGSDVYDFPYKSKLHHWLVQKNLYAADKLSSTSRCMMDQTLKIAPKLQPFDVVPFGVDIKKFIPMNNMKNQDEIVIGTVKTLSEKYGIDLLIQAFAILKNNLQSFNPDVAAKLRLRIVGGGELAQELNILTKKLKISDVTTFVGRVPHERVPDELNKLDIYVALSREESFGVAIIEAAAVQLPAVVANVGGLPEVVIHQQTGLIVPQENSEIAAEILEIMVLDEQKRLEMGKVAQNFVHENFSWEFCVQKMVALYTALNMQS